MQRMLLKSVISNFQLQNALKCLYAVVALFKTAK